MIGVVLGFVLPSTQSRTPRGRRAERRNDFEQRVFGLGAGHHQRIVARFEPQRGQQHGVGVVDQIRTIGNHADLVHRNARGKMQLDAGVVGNQHIAQIAAASFVEPQPSAFGQTPFGAAPLDTVHVDQIELAAQLVGEREQGGIVAQGQYGPGAPSGVPGGLPIEGDRPPGIVAADRHVQQSHVLPDFFAHGAAARLLAVDGNIPIALRKKQRQTLGERFETAMLGRNASGAQDRKRAARRSATGG